MWQRQIYPPLCSRPYAQSDYDALPRRAYHFSVSGSMRHAYYIGAETDEDEHEINELRVIDMFKGTNTAYKLTGNLAMICVLYEAFDGVALVGAGDDSGITIFQTLIDHTLKKLIDIKELLAIGSASGDYGTWSWNSTRSKDGMMLMELNQIDGKLRIYDIRVAGGATICAEIEQYETLGLAPYTQPWQDMTTISTFERLVTPFGRLAYTGRILNINVHTKEVEYLRPEGCPFAAQEGRELDAIISAPRLMKQIYRNGRLWVVAEKIAHMGKAVSLWTISGGKWQYVMELEANYRDITMDVNANDTAIILIKSSKTDGLSMNVRLKSLIMLRIGDAPKLTTIALLSHLNSSNNSGIDDHLCRMLENSSWH